MTIQKNSRQIPKHKDIISNRDFQDVIYAWFQNESDLQPDGTRIMPKERFSYNRLSQELDICRQTLTNYIKKMIKMGLFQINENGDYIIAKLENHVAMLVPYDTLRILIRSLQRNAVSLYVTLLNEYIINEQEPYYTTYVFLKEQLGISVTTRSNNQSIKDLLITLDKLGLVEWEVKQISPDQKRLYIKRVSNKLAYNKNC